MKKLLDNILVSAKSLLISLQFVLQPQQAVQSTAMPNWLLTCMVPADTERGSSIGFPAHAQLRCATRMWQVPGPGCILEGTGRNLDMQFGDAVLKFIV